MVHYKDFPNVLISHELNISLENSPINMELTTDIKVYNLFSEGLMYSACPYVK